MNKTILYHLLALLLLMGTTLSSYAQVTIGAGDKPKDFSVLELSTSGTKGGLRLPRLTTTERDQTLMAMPDFEDQKHRGGGLAVGLTIYNTTINCIEYWNGYKWVSLCLGSADINLENYPTLPLPPEGGETGGLIPKEEPRCAQNPPYVLSVMVGASYTTAYFVEESTGEFKVYMQANTTAKPRVAIVRLTNNCTGEYKEFLFDQDGNSGLCQPSVAKPEIEMSNVDGNGNGVICGDGSMGGGSSNGAIVLAIKNPQVGATYIWIRNDNEVIASDVNQVYIASSLVGRYKVYVGGIGCDSNVSDAVDVINNPSGTSPDAVEIMADNGATICGGTPVTLTVKDFSGVTVGATVEWYKNGLRLVGKIGQSLSVTDAGTYFAIVSDSPCASAPSNTIEVKKVAGTSTSFSDNDISVNGIKLTTKPAFCSEGWLNMKIDNIVTGYVYTWFVNGVQVGTGISCNYQLPGVAGGDVVLSVVAQSGVANTCPTAITVPGTISADTPIVPTIGGDSYFCSASGGATLNTNSNGDKYVWKNLTTGASKNTGTDPSLITKEAGAWVVEITSAKKCVSVTPTPKKIDEIGSPILMWDVSSPSVPDDPNTTVAFSVKSNGGASVTQGYTWEVKTKSGTALATPSGDMTGNRVEYIFTGGGFITMTTYGTGVCGQSSVLSQDIEVKQSKSITPDLEPNHLGHVCRGYTFTLTPQSLAELKTTYPSGFKIIWSATNTSNIGTLQYSGEHNEVCYVPFSSSSTGSITMTAQSEVVGIPRSTASNQVTATGNIGTENSYTVKGTTCFDVKQTNWEASGDKSCGLWAKRTEADFSQTYEYTLVGANLPANVTDYTWIVNDPDKVVESVDDNTAKTLKLKFKDVKQHAKIKGSKTGATVKVDVFIKVLQGGCLATYLKTVDINIRDCDCCSTATDIDGNTYSAVMFGDAGCWMTENLAVTKKPTGQNISSAVPGGNGNAAKARPKLNGGLSYGRHYAWAVMMNGEVFETIPEGSAGNTKSTVQGICPDGWVVPSDYDWNMLEKEIATKPSKYGSRITPITWQVAWETTKNWRPDTNGAYNWGQNMITNRTVLGLTNSSVGYSKAHDDGGFDVLLVGQSGNIATYSFFWTSSSKDGTYKWSRYLLAGSTGVNRNTNGMANLFSVRCKKKD